MKSVSMLCVGLALALGTAAQAKNGPTRCSIQAYDGHFLTAVGGGGRTSDVIHSDAKKVQSWEIFTLEDADLGTPNVTYGIKTKTGNYLTGGSGAGRAPDGIQPKATSFCDGEQFQGASARG